MSADLIINRLFEQAQRRPSSPAYYVRESGGWRPTSYRDYAGEVHRAARALITLGFEPGHDICVLGFNRPEWSISVLAAMAAGGAVAGVYTTCSAPEVQYIVDHAEARIVVVEDHQQWAKLRAELERLPRLRYVVLMRGAEGVGDDMVLTWEQFMAMAEATREQAVDDRVAAIEPDQLATLIYTSGTTGPPKEPAIGLGNARVCVSGAAPIAREVLEFFASLDIVILEVYGQSEDSGPTSYNLPNRFRLGSVGPVFPGVEVEIAEDGEILVRGPNVFLGYYKDEAATAETLIDGWLHSGDLGELRDGCELEAYIERINEQFARVEQIKKFKVLPRNLSQEQGELTPTLKVKRKPVHEYFAAEIESMYAE